MTKEQIEGLIRQMMPVIGGIFMALGFMTADKWNTVMTVTFELMGPVLIIASTVWSVMSKTRTAILISAAGLMDTTGTPLVKKVELNPRALEAAPLAAATPTNVVVGQ